MGSERQAGGGGGLSGGRRVEAALAACHSSTGWSETRPMPGAQPAAVGGDRRARDRRAPDRAPHLVVLAAGAAGGALVLAHGAGRQEAGRDPRCGSLDSGERKQGSGPRCGSRSSRGGHLPTSRAGVRRDHGRGAGRGRPRPPPRAIKLKPASAALLRATLCLIVALERPSRLYSPSYTRARAGNAPP